MKKIVVYKKYENWYIRYWRRYWLWMWRRMLLGLWLWLWAMPSRLPRLLWLLGYFHCHSMHFPRHTNPMHIWLPDSKCLYEMESGSLFLDFTHPHSRFANLDCSGLPYSNRRMGLHSSNNSSRRIQYDLVHQHQLPSSLPVLWGREYDISILNHRGSTDEERPTLSQDYTSHCRLFDHFRRNSDEHSYLLRAWGWSHRRYKDFISGCHVALLHLLSASRSAVRAYSWPIKTK